MSIMFVDLILLLINKSDNVEAVSNLVQHVKYMYEQNLAIHIFMYIVIVYRMLMSLRSQILLQRQTGKGNNDMFIKNWFGCF